jgi:hypothetical protein
MSLLDSLIKYSNYVLSLTIQRDNGERSYSTDGRNRICLFEEQPVTWRRYSVRARKENKGGVQEPVQRRAGGETRCYER